MKHNPKFLIRMAPSRKRSHYEYSFKQHHLPKRQKKGSFFLPVKHLSRPTIKKLANTHTVQEYKNLIRNASNPLIHRVAKIVQNAQDRTKCKLRGKLKKLTRAHSQYLNRLVKEGLPIDQRRRILQKGEGFGVIPALLAGLLPTVLSAIGGLVSGNRNE